MDDEMAEELSDGDEDHMDFFSDRKNLIASAIEDEKDSDASDTSPRARRTVAFAGKDEMVNSCGGDSSD